MRRLPNGMIAIIAGSIPGPKLLDIEVTNNFPLLALESKSFLLQPEHSAEDLSGYDHVSVPPDLRLHVSGPHDHLFFNAEPVWDFVDSVSAGVFHYFSFIGLPRHRVPPLVEEGETKTWHQGALIDPFPDAECNKMTRVFVDCFLHHLPINTEDLEKAPHAMSGMRLARDRNGPLFGPFAFSGFQRRTTPRDVPFTIRMGYVEMEDSNAVYLYTPLEVFQRRPRSRSSNP